MVEKIEKRASDVQLIERIIFHIYNYKNCTADYQPFSKANDISLFDRDLRGKL